MADLSRGPIIDAEALPGFVPTRSATGSLELRWVPFPADELHVWILLTDPASLVPGDLRPDSLLRELIRVPADAATGTATVYVPVERPLGLLLMARDAAGRPCPTPPFTARSGAPVARPATRPETRTSASDARTIPLVFARGRDPLPDLGGMARRIAERLGAPSQRVPAVSPLAAVAERIPAVSPLAAVAEPIPAVSPLAAVAGPPRPAPPLPAAPTFSLVAAKHVGFGAKQRWTLTRLGFAQGSPDRQRVVVVRPTFLDATTIRRWEAGPPPDAIVLPTAADGLVDALTADDAMVFYALFEQHPDGAAWQSLPLALLNPPFEASRHPFVLGDAAARLGPLAARPTTSDTHASLVAAALKIIVPSPDGDASEA